MAKPDAKLLLDALARIQREADPKATPAWMDGIAAGIFMTTDLPPRDILSCVLPAVPTFEQRQSVREVLVVELGSDSWSSSASTKAAAWLNSHRLPVSPG
jgi:hypothetical protein